MRSLALMLFLLPGMVLAVGSDDFAPPKPSETTTTCAEDQIWDLATQSCMSPEDSTNDDNARLDDIRELAYAGRYQTALRVLDALDDQRTSLALTYYGFVHRQIGQVERGMSYYAAALAVEPDNLLARSYMGQAHVLAGEVTLAQAQLTEIRMRGGRGTWAAHALARAIATGKGYSH